MGRIVGVFTMMVVSILAASVAIADNVEFRTVVNKNDASVGGEFYLDLEMRITSGTSLRTLNSLTADVYYGSELTEWSTNPGTGWAFGSSLGYTRSASKNSGYYRVLVTGGGVNEDAVECPSAGSPPGWDVTDSWQKIVTLRWMIAQTTSVNISIADDTDAAAYFVNYQNCFPEPSPAVENWTVANQDLGDTALPVELSSFAALYRDDGVVSIEWVTGSEVGNLGYYIYRSQIRDGEYTRINQVMIEGAGSSSATNTYRYVDDSVDLAAETYFYYLEDVDIAGTKSRSDIIQVVRPSDLLPIPKEFALLQNFPNPFNPETWIPYELAIDADVRLRIYNIQGQLVRTLDMRKQPAGSYSTRGRAAYWDGRANSGEKVASGVYLYTLRAGEFLDTRRMVILE